MDSGLSVVGQLPFGVSVSIAAHAIALATALIVVPASEATAPPPASVAVEIVEAAPPPPAPVPPLRVDPPAIPDEPAPAPTAVEPPTRPAITASTTAPSSSAAAATTTEPATAATAPGEPRPDAPRSSLLGMRRGTVDLRLPSGAFGDLERVPRGTAPAPEPPETGQLQPAGGGTHRSNQGVFTAKVAPDGSVTLKDARNLRVALALPRPKHVGQAISQWYDSDKGLDGQRGERTLEKEVSGSIDAGDRSRATVVPVVGGGFDVSDWLMRSKGVDPYAAKKLAFLDSTRDERVQIGNRHRARQLARTAEIMQQNLDRLWQRVTDPRARREALFELWDEVVETGDAATVEAGHAARALVLGAIRARFPAGTALAYSAEELAALNRRRASRTPFAPYD